MQIPVKELDPKAIVRVKTIAELGNRKRPLFMIVLMNGLAWGASFVVYQGGKLLGLG